MEAALREKDRCLGSTDGRGDGSCADWVPDIVTAWDITVSGPVEEICPEGVFRLSSTHGDDLILKSVGSATSHNAEQLRLEYRVLLHVHGAGLPVAVPLVDKQGRIAVPWGEQFYSLAPCLPNTGGDLMPADHDQLFWNYGRMIARMHQALATFPPHELGRFGRTDLESEVFEIGVPIILRYLPGKQADDFQTIIDDLTSGMCSAFPHLPEQLIHRDCHAGNLLSCGTEVTGIVDWDHLIIGPRILDIAYFAVQLAKHDVHDSKEMAQWLHDFPLLLQGYECESPLSGEEKSAFPYVLISVPILFAYWEIETSHDDSYIQTELDTVTWLHSSLELIRERVQAL